MAEPRPGPRPGFLGQLTLDISTLPLGDTCWRDLWVMPAGGAAGHPGCWAGPGFSRLRGSLLLFPSWSSLEFRPNCLQGVSSVCAGKPGVPSRETRRGCGPRPVSQLLWGILRTRPSAPCGFTASPLIRAAVVPGCAGQAGLAVRAHLELTGQPGGLLLAFSGGLRHNAGGWGAWGTLLPAQGPAQRLGDFVAAAANSWRNGLSPSTVSQGQA